MPSPSEILTLALKHAYANLSSPIVKDLDILERIEFVCRNIKNRAGVRVLLACSLAKMHNPEVDIRKPYTEIGDLDSYSGRSYDEKFVTEFIMEHRLPCNHTTAFLTPALRNRNVVLTPDTDLVGRPPELYEAVLELLSCVHMERISAENLLAETVRNLLIIREERSERIKSLLTDLKSSENAVSLSSEAIVSLIEQHLKCRRASRLPVLIVAAAYHAASEHLGERVIPLSAHTAADKQTGALGDLEITLINDDNIITSYEMKTRRVTQNDIDHALQKMNQIGKLVDNYIFITTDAIEDQVKDYAASMYDQTGGIEVVVLDCIAFLRHFLHLFHRLRGKFLEIYQELVLAEPNSAVSQPLKEAFLALRQAAEAGE